LKYEEVLCGVILLICIFLWTIFFLIAYRSRNYIKEDRASENSGQLRIVRAVAEYCYDQFHLEKTLGGSGSVKRALELLSPGVNQHQKLRKYVVEKIQMSIVIVGVCSILAVLVEVERVQDAKNGKYLMVTASDSGSDMYLDMEVDGQRKDQVEVHVREEPESKEDECIANQRRLYADAYQVIDQCILSENQTLTEVVSDLYFLEEIKELGVHIEWETSNKELITSSGKVHSETLTQSEAVRISGKIYNQPNIYLGSYEVNVIVIPHTEYEYQNWKNSLKTSIESEIDQGKNKRVITLPDQYNGRTIVWKGKKSAGGSEVLVIGALGIAAVCMLKDEKLREKIKKRENQMKQDYPDIINKLTLLMGAGMTLKGAWDRIAADYILQKTIRRKKSKEWIRYAYEEMVVSSQELSLGVTESIALEKFGKRAGTVEYMKLSGALIQNLRKGSDGFLEILSLMSKEAFDERQQRAKKIGEEAGTKLLLPMVIMLVVVLVIIMVPAFWSMQVV